MLRTLKTIVKGSRIWRHARALYRRRHREITANEAKTIKEYLAQEGTRKLQLGGGSHALEGWLNSDYAPDLRHVITIDATKRFPFEDETFDYIFSEHMINMFHSGKVRSCLASASAS